MDIESSQSQRQAEKPEEPKNPEEKNDMTLTADAIINNEKIIYPENKKAPAAADRR